LKKEEGQASREQDDHGPRNPATWRRSLFVWALCQGEDLLKHCVAKCQELLLVGRKGVALGEECGAFGMPAFGGGLFLPGRGAL